MKGFIRKFKNKDLLNRIKNRFYIKIGLFGREGISTPSTNRKLDGNYQIVIVNNSHIDLLKKYSIEHRSPGHFEKNIFPRLSEKNRFTGFAAIDSNRNELAYLSWIDFRSIKIKEIDFCKDLSETEAYFLDDDCVPFHQRKGIHNAVFIERLNYCIKKGIKKIYIVVYLNNFRALQNLKKFDFKLYKTMMFYPFLKLVQKHE